MVPSEPQRVERVLARARAFLAIFSLVAIYFNFAGLSHYAALTHVLLLLYVIHSLIILVLLQLRQESTPAFRLSVHAVDVLWAALMSLSTEALNSPVFVFFLFVLLAAAYRWGFLETLATAGASIVLLFFETILVGSRPNHSGHLLLGEFDMDRLVMRPVYLVMIGYLVGYLGEKEKQLRAETSIISRIMGKAHSESGVRETLEAVLRAILELFGANQVLLALQETTSWRAFLWEARRPRGSQEITVQFSELQSFERERYFFAASGHSWCALRLRRPWRGQAFHFLVLGSDGERLHNISCSFPEYFLTQHDFRSLLAVSFSLEQEWSGRLFLFDPRVGADRDAELRFLQALVRDVGAAVYTVYLLRRLRTRAGAIERARVARELHDGVIQSLISLEMQLDVLRRQAAGDPARMADDLKRIQQLLRQEILNLREVMQQIKPLDLGPKQLLDFLADLVDKFRLETGISASFVSEFEEVALPPRVCREVARIVQEALINVRKHSGARNVFVRFTSEESQWKLVIDDDGRGFDFSGRLSQAELDAALKGPGVIKERVRSIGGELAVESIPGGGARLEIALPQKAHG